jgi:hypothetical protein
MGLLFDLPEGNMATGLNCLWRIPAIIDFEAIDVIAPASTAGLSHVHLQLAHSPTH